MLGQDGEAGGQRVAAEALQQLGAALQRLKQVEAPEAPAGALAPAVLEADHKGGAGEALGQAGGHDAHHPLVPPLSGQDDAAAGSGALPLQTGQALGKDLPLDVLSLPVELAQLVGELLGPAGVLGEQQLGGQGRPAHAPGGVDARGQGKADAVGGQGLSLGPCLPDQGLHAGPLGAGQHVQAPADQGPVLAGEAHDVGHRAHGGQVGVALQHRRALRRGREGQRHL